MNSIAVFFAGAFSLTVATALAAAEAVDAPDMGLSKTSVFDTPVPEPFTYIETNPRKSVALPRAFAGAPPQIPHSVDDLLPIRVGDENLCLDCHDKPERWDKQLAEGKATPMPRSHYTDLRTPGSQVGQSLRGARYFCTQCHAPQATVNPLVENRFAPVALDK